MSVVEEIGEEIIIGNKHMKEWNIWIDFINEEVHFGSTSIVPANIRKDTLPEEPL